MPDPRQDWHPEDIKAAIRKTGITLKHLALEHGYSESAARCALRDPSPRLEQIMARRLGLQPEQIWPSRYTPDGLPLPRRKNSNTQTASLSGGAQPQMATAA
jgi:Ner family transcriptional regulator